MSALLLRAYLASDGSGSILLHLWRRETAPEEGQAMTEPIERFGAPASEFSELFVERMRTRMAVSYHKYGPVAEAAGRIDALASLHQRLDRYRDDGNREWLVDAANFAMIESMFPQHPEAHYRATDSDESPGRTAVTERSRMTFVSGKPNEEL